MTSSRKKRYQKSSLRRRIQNGLVVVRNNYFSFSNQLEFKCGVEQMCGDQSRMLSYQCSPCETILFRKRSCVQNAFSFSMMSIQTCALEIIHVQIVHLVTILLMNSNSSRKMECNNYADKWQIKICNRHKCNKICTNSQREPYGRLRTPPDFVWLCVTTELIGGNLPK